MTRKINVLCGYDKEDKTRDAMLTFPSYHICANKCVEITLSELETAQLVSDLLGNLIYCEGLERR